MRRNADVLELEAALRSRGDLIDSGWSERAIAAAVESRSLRRIRRGWYVEGSLWDGLWNESRHLLHVIAVARDAEGERVAFAGPSAAVLWALPLYRWMPRRVHVIASPSDRRSGADVFRHEGALPDTDLTIRDGLACTVLERTVADIARFADAEAAIAASDAAVQHVAGSPRAYDHDAAAAWRERMAARLATPGARGVRRARRIVALADGRAERPGESVSRLQLRRLGFQRFELQVPVPGPEGATYWVDLGIEDASALGEFDGKGKYLDEEMRGDAGMELVLMREKEREDWIRGVTQRRFARWGSADILTAHALGARLARFGIRPPRS